MTTARPTHDAELTLTASPTAHLLDELALYGHRPHDDESDPRPLPEPDKLRGALADVFDALVATLSDTRLEPDLQTLLWSVVNVFHRRIDRIERDLDDNERAQRTGQREQDGSEVRSVELERLVAQGLTLIERRNSFEFIRDAAAELYGLHTGQAWRPRAGSMVNRVMMTAAMIDSREFINARHRTDALVLLPKGTRIAFAGGVDCNDHHRIWAVLDKVMGAGAAVATTAAAGGTVVAGGMLASGAARLAGRASGAAIRAAASLTGTVGAAYQAGGIRGVARATVSAPAGRAVASGTALAAHHPARRHLDCDRQPARHRHRRLRWPCGPSRLPYLEALEGCRADNRARSRERARVRLFRQRPRQGPAAVDTGDHQPRRTAPDRAPAQRAADHHGAARLAAARHRAQGHCAPALPRIDAELTNREDTPMPVIGTFQAVKDGYAGSIRTLMLNGRVRILANDRKNSESAPDFRISLGTTEIGAAWRRTKQGTDQTYLRVRLDDPAWPQPIWGVLLESTEDGLVRLIWRRDTREEGSDNAR
jgi:uncharacterized protein (DUF736 family)